MVQVLIILLFHTELNVFKVRMRYMSLLFHIRISFVTIVSSHCEGTITIILIIPACIDLEIVAVLIALFRSIIVWDWINVFFHLDLIFGFLSRHYLGTCASSITHTTLATGRRYDNLSGIHDTQIIGEFSDIRLMDLVFANLILLIIRNNCIIFLFRFSLMRFIERLRPELHSLE